MIKITETENYRELIPFFIENELEFEKGEEYGDDELLKCWRADGCAASTGGAQDPAAGAGALPAAGGDTALVGGCILAMREGEYICDGIAVAPELRKTGLGRQLLDLLLDEARSRGAQRLFLVARAPAFFAKSGFTPIERADAPDFFECFSCPQYGKTCHPEVMTLRL
jgi:GNAT superfamily N-acetyltransferase